jgi:hypothetical protein
MIMLKSDRFGTTQCFRCPSITYPALAGDNTSCKKCHYFRHFLVTSTNLNEADSLIKRFACFRLCMQSTDTNLCHQDPKRRNQAVFAQEMAHKSSTAGAMHSGCLQMVHRTIKRGGKGARQLRRICAPEASRSIDPVTSAPPQHNQAPSLPVKTL